MQKIITLSGPYILSIPLLVGGSLNQQMTQEMPAVAFGKAQEEHVPKLLRLALMA